jgi:four helix bundle protein
MQNYKDLNVWKEAHDLVLYLYKLTVAYPKVEQFPLTSQLRRAVISIPANIAEG